MCLESGLMREHHRPKGRFMVVRTLPLPVFLPPLPGFAM